MFEFKATHKITNTETKEEMLVEKHPVEDEFYTFEEYKLWLPQTCEIGNYCTSDEDEALLQSSTIHDEELGEVLVWLPTENLILERICVKCHSKNVVRNGSNSCDVQRYLCNDCGSSFTGTKIGRPCIGDRAMSVAERVEKYRSKNS